MALYALGLAGAGSCGSPDVTLPTAALQRITVTSPTTTLAAGATEQFSATGVFSDGSTSAIAVSWTATGGAITPGGLYTAGNTAGSFQVTATQQGGSASATAAVTISLLPQVMLAPPSHDYTTNFPLTENPISEGGAWINGGAVGLSWTNVSTTPGLAIGHEVGASYTDATAILAGTWGPNQQATATVYTVNQRDACYQEFELRLRSAISARVNRGYEIGFKASQTSQAYLIIVRWNGALGNYTVLLSRNGSQYGTKSGDVISARMIGNVITAFKNGVQMGQVTDNAYTSGTPGMGFNLENAPSGCAGTNGNYGFTTFTATDAPTAPPPPTLTQVILTPATVSLPAGRTQQFAVSGRLSDGTTNTPAVTYSATGGTITSAGLYTAGSTTGTFRVIATQQGGTLADTSAVAITPAVLTQVILNPATVTLPAGLTQQFVVSGRLSNGTSNRPAATYSATGGTISAGGLYTAGGTTGTFRVIAVQQGGTLADTSAMTITAPVLTQVILTPSTASLPAGLTQQFAVSGRLSNGATTTPTVTYSATGGTISAGGLYAAGSTTGAFRVIATQQGGTLADTSAVTITAPVLTQIVISPPTATLATGASQPFAVSGTLSDGSASTPAVTYGATGGTITTGGLFTAGSTAGSFQVTATQQGGTLASSAAVTITAPPPPPTLTQLILNPSSVNLQPAGTQQFQVSGVWSDGGSTVPVVTYSATGGTITATGLFTAGTAAGTYQVTATQQGGTLVATSVVNIAAPPPTLTQLILNPSSVNMQAAGTQQFQVSGVWSDGSSTVPVVSYSATGGTITAAGLYTAGSTAGTYQVTATQQGGTLVANSVVTISATPPPPPTLTQLILNPSTVTLQPGGTQQLQVSGVWSDGSTTTPAVTYSATGGTVTAEGLYTAGNADGTFEVTATQQGGSLVAHSVVTIAAPPPPPPTLTQLILNPSTVTLPTAGSQQFSVSGVWSDGSSTAPAVTYSTSGGTITAAGLYTAGNSAGTFRVIAVQQGGTLADTSAVTITAPPPTLTQLILNPSTVSLSPGGSQQFAVSGVWSDGSATTPAVTWSATGGTITPEGLFTAGSSPGTFQVVATQQGGTLTATSVVTVTAPPPTLTQVVLTPAAVTLAAGATQQFTVSGKLSDGSTSTPAVTYLATGGSITSAGLYTAGTAAGTYQVVATLQGGTLTGTSSVTITTGHNYTTSFPMTENPISEGGNWIGGFTSGLRWSNVQTTPGLAFGRQQLDWAQSYSDGTALLTGAWGPDQQATATVYSAGTAPDDYYEEVELRLRSAISANSNTGYEIGWKVSSNSSAYLIIVRWDGPWSSYTYLPGGLNGASAGVKNGDVVSAKIVGNLISVYKNGALVTTSDITGSGGTVYTSGAPGMGFNLEAAGAGHNADFGYTSFTATDTP